MLICPRRLPPVESPSITHLMPINRNHTTLLTQCTNRLQISLPNLPTIVEGKCFDSPQKLLVDRNEGSDRYCRRRGRPFKINHWSTFRWCLWSCCCRINHRSRSLRNSNFRNCNLRNCNLWKRNLWNRSLWNRRPDNNLGSCRWFRDTACCTRRGWWTYSKRTFDGRWRIIGLLWSCRLYWWRIAGLNRSLRTCLEQHSLRSRPRQRQQRSWSL